MRGLSVEEAAIGRGSRWAAVLLLLLLLLLLLGLCLVVVPFADAGQYHVYSCRTPTGAPAPISGWSGSTNGSWTSDPNSCEGGGSLTAALDGNVSHPANQSAATWVFSAPAGTSIEAARLWRSAYAHSLTEGANSTVTWLAAPEDQETAADVFDKCARFEECLEVGNPSVPMASENLVQVPSGNLSGAAHIYMDASCGGTSSTSCPAVSGVYSVAISLYAADIVLSDDTPPTVSGVGGSLVAPGTLSGVGDVSFSAADTGSGLYEAVFLVDGHAVSLQLLNSGSGPCRNVGGTSDGSDAFFEVEPCPQTLSDDLSFDTTLAPDGSHLFTVEVLDAAGNAATILNRQVTFANHVAGVPVGAGIGPGSPSALRGPANGTNAADQATLTAHWASTAKATRTSDYGHNDRITGRLTAQGATPISGASLGVYLTPAYEGARTTRIANVATGPSGQWTLTLPRGISSSALRFEYRSHQNDTIPVATAALSLRVHAGVALRIAPRISSVGHSIFFSGVVHGTPIPPGGKQLVLEASSGGEWIQFNTIRTDARGRYRASYRFKFPGPINYKFRVLSRYEADFPFLGGTSNVVGVLEH